MIKKDKGITLMSLVITIIVLGIIAASAITYNITVIREARNEKIKIELSVVQEAIVQQYALLKSKNKTGIKVKSPVLTTGGRLANTVKASEDVNRPEELIGTRICNTDKMKNIYGFENNKITFSINEQKEYSYEEFYYLLEEEDLLKLGIKKDEEENLSDDESNTVHSYIVNYLTGEVYDLENETYYEEGYTEADEPAYLEGTDKNPYDISNDIINYDDEDE